MQIITLKKQQLAKKYLPTKIYDVGENVLIRWTKKNGILNTKLRHVIRERICKKGKNSICNVKFRNGYISERCCRVAAKANR